MSIKDTRTITLIGGKFHRKKVEVKLNQHTVNMASPSDYGLLEKEVGFEPSINEITVYGEVSSIFGITSIIPSDIFFNCGIDPILFLKNLVLDYVR